VHNGTGYQVVPFRIVYQSVLGNKQVF
jgi:hypothetical protein